MGTDPSAAAGPYGTGGILRAAACFVFAGGPYAINPERSESSGLVAPSQAADACIATCRLQKAYETPAAGTLFGEEPYKSCDSLSSVIQDHPWAVLADWL